MKIKDVIEMYRIVKDLRDDLIDGNKLRHPYEVSLMIDKVDALTKFVEDLLNKVI